MNCPVCESTPASVTKNKGYEVVECPRCGRWSLDTALSQEAIDGLQWKLDGGDRKRTRLRSQLSHLIRRRQPSNGGIVQIKPDIFDTWRLEDPLPSPSQQLDELILRLGDCQPSAAEPAALSADAISAWIGTAITPNSPNAVLGWLLQQEKARSLIEQRQDSYGVTSYLLTMAGWDRYFLLKQAKVASRTAFMAMKFNDNELTHVVDNCFRPAVSRAGFDLRVLTDRQGAGSIDDQLRVALRNSRFVLADLSHSNPGAYWEAGFAEGLNRPVIYTCKRSVWDSNDPKIKPHFDTNHLVTIIWEADKPEEVQKRLIATIRATLPDEAKMAD